jgi:hypothetical protein
MSFQPHGLAASNPELKAENIDSQGKIRPGAGVHARPLSPLRQDTRSGTLEPWQ